MIFVFGSNLAGRHGAGCAALIAKENYGAIYGMGKGRQGQSYAIPTKDQKLKTLPLDTIKFHVEQFIQYARQHPYEIFYVTAIGTGLAGYKNEQIAPMFINAPDNCTFCWQWVKIFHKMGKPAKEYGQIEGGNNE